MLDLLIKNGTVVDGTGSPEYQADIGIKGEMISQIASKIGEPAKETIDAGGYVVSPGFIDIHSHSDLTPFFQNIIWTVRCVRESRWKSLVIVVYPIYP